MRFHDSAGIGCRVQLRFSRSKHKLKLDASTAQTILLSNNFVPGEASGSSISGDRGDQFLLAGTGE